MKDRIVIDLFYKNANDPFLIQENSVERLYGSWKRYGKIIIGYDFDDTIYDFRGSGNTHELVIDLLKRCEKIGAIFICSTCRPESEYNIVLKHLAEKKIPCNRINQNVDFVGNVSSKIYCNILLDDKAGLRSAYDDLMIVVERMERESKKL